MSEGNHDCKESQDEQTEKDIESWMSPLIDLTITPEVNPHDESWEKTKWIYSWQYKKAYFIVMNTEDNDIVFKRNQYNWVVKQLEIVKKLKAEGKVDWTFVIFHKPIYTLKSKAGHAPLIEVRRIFQPLFDDAGVDFVLSGHNHNFQMWVPMSYDATPKFTKEPDGTYDFSKPHGQFYIINGAGGHEINKFKEDWKKNDKVIGADDTQFSYTLFYINYLRECDVTTMGADGSNLGFSIEVDK